MNRSFSFTRPAVLAFAVLCSGCATTAAVVTARTLALVDVRFAEGRFDGSAVVHGEESPSSQLATALLRELARTGRFEVSDARDSGASAAGPGGGAPMDATLDVRILACGAWPSSALEFGRQVHWYAGECTAELTVRDAAGKTLATLQKTGRWDSAHRESPEGKRAMAQAVAAAVDDLAVRLAAGLKAASAGK